MKGLICFGNVAEGVVELCETQRLIICFFGYSITDRNPPCKNNSFICEISKAIFIHPFTVPIHLYFSGLSSCIFLPLQHQYWHGIAMVTHACIRKVKSVVRERRSREGGREVHYFIDPLSIKRCGWILIKTNSEPSFNAECFG